MAGWFTHAPRRPWRQTVGRGRRHAGTLRWSNWAGPVARSSCLPGSQTNPHRPRDHPSIACELTPVEPYPQGHWWLAKGARQLVERQFEIRRQVTADHLILRVSFYHRPRRHLPPPPHLLNCHLVRNKEYGKQGWVFSQFEVNKGKKTDFSGQ